MATKCFYPLKESETMQRWHAVSGWPLKVLEEGATEPPGSTWNHQAQPAVFCCIRCDQPLFLSEDELPCGCGWPSFQRALPDALSKHPDRDGERTEVRCARCAGHLGHVFYGEQLSETNTRFCINGCVLHCIPTEPHGLSQAVLAGGCFWGLRKALAAIPGVLDATSGFMGGPVVDPTYHEVCQGDTGHAEVVNVLFRASDLHYKSLLEHFFYLHDPTQWLRQGADVGEQYRSAIFYTSRGQQRIAEEAVASLRQKGVQAVTQVLPVSRFYPADPWHQAQ